MISYSIRHQSMISYEKRMKIYSQGRMNAKRVDLKTILLMIYKSYRLFKPFSI